RLARREELRSEIVERAGEPLTRLYPCLLVFRAEQEVHGIDLLVDELADRIAALDTAAVLRDLRLLLGDAAERQAEAAEAAVRGVQRCTRAGDGDPQRRGEAPVRRRQ